MSDFSQTIMFVVPPSNTLRTTLSTNVLTPGQFSIYKHDYTAATAANVGTAQWIFFAQGRPQTLPGVGTMQSAKISNGANGKIPKNIKEFYKVTAHSTASVQITEVSDFSATCGEDVTITLRLKSKYLDVSYYNHLTQPFTITTPCCDCGDDPCTEVDSEALIDQFVAQINAHTIVSQFVVAEKLPDGGDFKLRITGKQITADPTYSNPYANPLWYDVVNFWVYATNDPAFSQNYEVYDSCSPFATVETLQEASYLRGSSDQIRQMEMDYWYMSNPSVNRNLFEMDIFNNGYTSQVVAGTYYDVYFLKFDNTQDNAWNPGIKLDYTVIIAVPTGQATTIETIMTTYLGAIDNKSGSSFTTSTTTSTTTV